LQRLSLLRRSPLRSWHETRLCAATRNTEYRELVGHEAGLIANLFDREAGHDAQAAACAVTDRSVDD
jgi:hypothetical protein